ncbi:SAM-dependent chlorinase/fluorinase [Thioalkalicoccus limnaeus]|uniref:SAM-dependent chlorinase/fluorinase n=1 Tax=Thioalkalicoccus limnaeus TaxID=120681 RepID=A0ABV4BCZ3_9GAMM
MLTFDAMRIALATDFGAGPYVGQMQLALSAPLPGLPCIDLIHDLPPFRPDLAAYLLLALVRDVPDGTLYLAIVDPGVGGPRDVLFVEADGNGFIGPDNGLLAIVARRARRCAVHRLAWRPARMSRSFHGRDLMVPLVARLLSGRDIAAARLPPTEMVGAGWPERCARIIYADHYGNLMTGLRVADLQGLSELDVGGERIQRAETFCEVPPGAVFWYENALGLVEFAVNQGRADERLALRVGDSVDLPAP